MIRHRDYRQIAFKYSLIMLAAWGVSTALRSYVGEWMVVPTTVMLPNIIPGDWLWVSQSSDFSEIKKGDLIAHRTELEQDRVALRRVVGLPGESIKMISGRLWSERGPHPFEADPESEGCGTERQVDAEYSVCMGSFPADAPALIVLQSNELAVAADHRTSVDFSPVFEVIRLDQFYGKVSWGFRPKTLESIRIRTH